MSSKNQSKNNKPKNTPPTKITEKIVEDLVQPKEDLVSKTEEAQLTGEETVKMKFSEHKYYNDLSNPIFYAGKIYEVKGAAWIQKWLKRGGIIVEGTLPTVAPDALNPSIIIEDAPSVETMEKTEESGKVVDDKKETNLETRQDSDFDKA